MRTAVLESPGTAIHMTKTIDRALKKRYNKR